MNIFLDDAGCVLPYRKSKTDLDPKDGLADKEISDNFLDIGIGWKRLPQLQIIGMV